VLECAANVACTGGEVLGVTDNLSFGNPEKPYVAWQLTESVRGLGDACRALRAPIVGGNVSLYNDGPAGPIYPTPVVGMVGYMPDARRAGRIGFVRAGAQVAVVGPFAPALAASELHKLWGEPLPDGLGTIDIDAVAQALAAVREAVRAGALDSAHDIAEGGVAVAVAECCLAGGVGAEIELPPVLIAPAGAGADLGVWSALFGEGAGGFVVSGSEEAVRALGEHTTALPIGTVGGQTLSIGAVGSRVEASLEQMQAANGSMRALFP
jgi:phosphoribosylformylglycinamidine (FGAM) synthase-like enzyme